MKSKGLIDWRYYGIIFVLFSIGYGVLYLGSQVYDHTQLMNVGLWIIFSSIFLFFAKSAYYMVENTDPNWYGQ